MANLRAIALILLALFLSVTPRADELPLEVPQLELPHAEATPLPVVAVHGMVATQERHATQVGIAVLRRGGNAVDAAVAVALTLAVTLPKAGNLGGGGFMLIHIAQSGRDVAIDYRETATRETTRKVFLDDQGEAVAAKSRDTGLGVGVPGTVAGLVHALTAYGSGKFGLADLAAPAIALARDGFAVDDDLALSLPLAAPRLARWPASAKIFLHGGTAPLVRGEKLVQSDLADSLEQIAREGEKAFYEGAIAAKIVAAVQQAGGHMTLADLAAYRARERVPLRGIYRGHEIVAMPPPSSGGIHILEILNILEGFPLQELGSRSPQTLHLMAEAMKLAYADRAEYLGDPDFVPVPVTGLVSKAYAAHLRAEIDADRARPAAEIKAQDPQPYESDQTTHFSIVDADGNAVANTYTLNFSYGLGLVAEGTGILLNNELDDFAAKAGVPNAFGLLGGAANEPGPQRRPLSSMAPTMVFHDGELELVTGSPGGSRIITIVLQIILDVLDFDMNIAAATAATRIHDQWMPDQLQVEPGLPHETIEDLENRGHKVVERPPWGSAQSIARHDGLLFGAADPRQKGTSAEGY
ncbi:MAG: gamma-glutamyltransferase [Beijerinckiaceae bacterium]